MGEEEIPVEELAGLVKQRVFEEQEKPAAVINATGVVLHTNLGRVNLSRRACGAYWRRRLLLKPGIRYKERQQRFAP
ncbi:MAG: hypothetical protein ACLUOI_38770 [Eisenbergiella sp.]